MAYLLVPGALTSCATVASPPPAPAAAPRSPGPHPGDVFREYLWLPGDRFPKSQSSPHLVVADPACDGHYCKDYRTPQIATIRIDDLDRAVRAELVVEEWGGHLGSANKAVRFGEHAWIPLATPRTPDSPECYFYDLHQPPVAIPLAHLREGENRFQLRTSPGKCRFAGYPGWFWIYSVRLRIYYDPATKPHATGRLTVAAAGAAMAEMPDLTFIPDGGGRDVARVEFIGEYEDFDWEGDGVFRKWHFQYFGAELRHHVGTSHGPVFAVEWDTTWIPDQREPIQLAARVVDRSGLIAMTPAVSGLTLVRKGRSVRMFKATGVPQAFGVRLGMRKTCTIEVEGDPAKVHMAKLAVSTWSGANEFRDVHELGLNGVTVADNFGKMHDRATSELFVPPKLIRAGANEIFIRSEFKLHALEINWPGPVLLVEFLEGPP